MVLMRNKYPHAIEILPSRASNNHQSFIVALAVEKKPAINTMQKAQQPLVTSQLSIREHTQGSADSSRIVSGSALTISKLYQRLYEVRKGTESIQLILLDSFKTTTPKVHPNKYIILFISWGLVCCVFGFG